MVRGMRSAIDASRSTQRTRTTAMQTTPDTHCPLCQGLGPSSKPQHIDEINLARDRAARHEVAGRRNLAALYARREVALLACGETS